MAKPAVAGRAPGDPLPKKLPTLSLRTSAIKMARSILARAGLEVKRARVDDIADYVRIYGPDSVASRRFFNVGAGDFDHPCWTNLDFESDWYASVQNAFLSIDLMSEGPFPIADGTAELIYTSHTVEHLPERAVERLIANAFAALRNGGVLRVTCPDADLGFRALIAGDTDWFYWDEEASANFDTHSRGIHRERPNTRPIEERWLHYFASQLAPNALSPSPVKFAAAEVRQIIAERGMASALDFFTGLCTYQPEHLGNHISWWNADKLIDRMMAAGFKSANRCAFGQSAAHVLRNTHYFDTRPKMSLFVEAVR